MPDKPRKHRSRLLPDTEVIDGAEAGSNPDVQVFDLDGSDPGERRPAPATLEEARTTEWLSQDLQGAVPSALRRSKQVTGSIEVEDAAAPRPRVATPAGASTTEETDRDGGHRADSALIRTGAALHEDPIDGAPTDPTGSPFAEAYPTDPGFDQDVEAPRGSDQRSRLEAPLQIKIQAVAGISPDPRLRVVTASSSQAAEQYRVLSLKLKEGRTIRRVVAIAAPTTECEGPILAANLALALAEGRRARIALIDADLRDGQLARLFELTVGPGLAAQIRSHRRTPEQPWILLSITGNLHFIPAGAAEKNPSSLLNSEVLGDLVAELRRSYDFIIVSTPPVTVAADVNILQEHVDGAILVVRTGVTKKDAVTASIARLGTRKFVGAVLV